MCWCSRRGAGWPAGELEVAARVVNRALGSTHRLYMMTRHFVWLVPLIDLVLFLGIGACWPWRPDDGPARAGWWGPRLIIALAILPALALAGREIYLEAWAMVALGVAVRVAPMLDGTRPARGDGWLRTGPALLGLVLLQAAWLSAPSRSSGGSSEARPCHRPARPTCC